MKVKTVSLTEVENILSQYGYGFDTHIEELIYFSFCVLFMNSNSPKVLGENDTLAQRESTTSGRSMVRIHHVSQSCINERTTLSELKTGVGFV